ncbi:MAG: NUDIX hydrolase [Alphaproteobacteria bacterium]|nr:NUDIX hydrolase [Alphaproteobacteria bacterium]
MSFPVRTVFSTPWFQIEELDTRSHADYGGQPYYRLTQSDGVMILPITASGNLILIRHYRLAPDVMVTEFPAGGIDKGETPLEAAKRELAEETGLISDHFTYLGAARLRMERETDRQHMFVAENAVVDPEKTPEPGIELIEMTPEALKRQIAEQKFFALPSIGLLMAAECVLGRSILPR